MKKINKKGQALVEFIIILPIFIFMVLAIIDVGKMLYSKNQMQNNLNEVVSMYKDGKKLAEMERFVKEIDRDMELSISNDSNKYIEISISKKPEITTPGLNLILKKDIIAKRVINYD